MPKRNLIWIVAVAAAALAAVLATRDHNRVSESPGCEFDPVADAYRAIRDNYLYPIDGNTLRREAVAAMAARLDEYSRYIPPGKAEGFARRMQGMAWGLGLKVRVDARGPVVLGALVNSPAQTAGFRPGDRIVAIDGNDVAGLSQSQVDDLFDAPAPAGAAVAVVGPGCRRELVSAIRAPYRLQSVQGLYRGPTGRWVHLVDPGSGFGYIRIREFLPSTGEEIQSVFRQLGRLHGLVLDLRDNPGGSLPAAIELCDLFLDEGVIVTVVDRAGHAEKSLAHEPGTLPRDIAVVVLVNSRTASAAELVAGALQFHARAVILGQCTRGKGCVQSMIPLTGDMGQLNLTTAEFFVQPGKSILRHHDAKTWGIEPHVQLAVDADLEAALDRLRQAGELLPPHQPATSPASRPIANDTTAQGLSPKSDSARRSEAEQAAEPDDDIDPATVLQTDPQLRAAVDLLRKPDQMKSILDKPATQPAEAGVE